MIGGSIFVVGGRSLFGWSSESSSFSPRGDGWEASTPLATPAVAPGVAAVDGKLVVHAAGTTPGTLEVQECTVASTFYVHCKAEAVEGDIEPQLVRPASEHDEPLALEQPELESWQPASSPPVSEGV